MIKTFLKESKANTRIYAAALIPVSLITLLTGACAGKSQKLESAETDKIVNMKDYQEIVCRTRAVTGSRFKKKVCATKAEWADIDKKNRKNVDEWEREVGNKSRTFGTGGSSDSMGGTSTGMPH